MKRALITLVILVTFFLNVDAVMADGQYGQYGGGGEEPSEQPKEEVVHATVDADLGDNLLILAAFVGGASLFFLILSRVTARVYLLDN